ncbi:MAG: SDR family oxidoreductase [Thermoguttaceae bacterium]|jgi:NAD(P)-dependent dehydrogenase (short-subunit alcohol dehydrogenase family)|nr:SDR family oxidoreductase [Thermoguttaceae bacterium]
MKDNPFDLTGRIALITGGSKGIGYAIASGFARAGADLFLCSRSEEPLLAAMEKLQAQTSARVEATCADMAIREDVQRIADEAVAKFGRVDILVNNAGWNIVQAIDEIRDDDWQYLLDLNLTNVMALTRALVPGMKQRGWGRVIHISSIMALGSTPKRNAYSATKAALIGLAKASALDLGPFGVTVNCIAPGPIATEMPMSILSQQQQDTLAAKTALGRWAQPEELIGPALLLASEAGSYITGTCLVVDGGALSRVF